MSRKFRVVAATRTVGGMHSCRDRRAKVTCTPTARSGLRRDRTAVL